MPDYRSVYQPTQPTTQPPVITPNQLYSREYAQAVGIPLLLSVVGGVGLGGLVLAIGLRAGGTLEAVGLWALFVGALVMFGGMAFRAFRDEVRLILSAYGERQDKATRAALQGEVEQLRRELKALRSAGVVSSQFEVLMTAERLLHDKLDLGLPIDRRKAEERGYNRGLVSKAFRIMNAAGVIDGKSEAKVATFAEAWSRVLRSQNGGQGQYVVTDNKDLVKTA